MTFAFDTEQGTGDQELVKPWTNDPRMRPIGALRFVERTLEDGRTVRILQNYTYRQYTDDVTNVRNDGMRGVYAWWDVPMGVE